MFLYEVEVSFLDAAGFFRVSQLSEHVKGWSHSRRFSEGSSPVEDYQSEAEVRQGHGYRVAFIPQLCILLGGGCCPAGSLN